MPYIKKKYRKNLNPIIKQIVEATDDFSDDEIEGVLNYILTTITNRVMKPKGGWRYYAINRTFGVLEAVKTEFARRVAGAYEDNAILVNGDIEVYDEFDMEREAIWISRCQEKYENDEKQPKSHGCQSGCCSGNPSRDA